MLKAEIDVTEVHDCSLITDVAAMENLGLPGEGRTPFDNLDGCYDAQGAMPANSTAD